MARTVLVTGGNRGIGLAIAETFAAQGDRVAITHRGKGGASADDGAPGVGATGTCRYERLFGVACEMTDPASIDAAFAGVEEALGPVEVLVCNAGITEDTLLMRMSEEQFTRVLDTNLTGAWRCAKRATPKMLRAKWGRMIFVSSVVGLMGGAGQVNYAASKAGMVGIARSITREMGSRNLTANVVTPGFIETEMTAVLPDDKKAEYLQQIPARRMGQSAEVGAVIAWLASDAAAYVNGAVIPVDGGLSMGH